MVAQGDDLDTDVELKNAASLPSELKTKHEKKEEGRLRALEMSMAKQKVSSNPDNDNKLGKKSGKRGNRKSARHGARNQNRHKMFAKWILDRFPHVLQDCNSVKSGGQSSNDEESSIGGSLRMHVLDVAGGKGELSARLSLCHCLNVVMIDPRPANIASVYMNSVVPKLPKKWQTSIKEGMKQSPTLVTDRLEKRFSQLVMPFTSPSCPFFGIPTDEVVSQYKDETLHEAVRNASLIVGLHADGATEAIVDAALSYCKPFVVVPCCVFPNLFNQRYITVPVDNAPREEVGSDRENNGSMQPSSACGDGSVIKVPVRTHDQFCKYLLAKDPRFVMEVLPFEGRNLAVWWDGKS